MSFGILNLKNSQDQSGIHAGVKVLRKKAVVVGNNIGAMLTGLLYQKKYGETETILLTDKQISGPEYVAMFKHYLLFVRGKEQAESFRNLFPGVALEEFEEEPYFYKDQAFKPFDGRAKPHTLMPFESYFIERPYTFSVEELLESEGLSVNDLKSSHFIVSQVSKEDNGLWRLVGSDGTVIETENLMWGDSRKKYYNVAKQMIKESGDEQCVPALLGFEQVPILQAYWVIDEVVREKSQTFFIPQSQTHDWGHFIVDFSKPKKLSDGKSSQVVRILCLIGDDEVDEEFLGKKLRLIKRNLNRIFPDIGTKIINESVFYYDDFLCALRDEESLEDVVFEHPDFPMFIGPQASLSKKTFSNCNFPFIMNMFNAYNDHRQKLTAIQ
ncbi:MAG: hypothetical protein H6621_12930 [Halobacteriovoraceae bacterium]|nr:hypothetical protein [Halobacteriovoraceae bacterium]MCB9095966.1 hypothetical protein [Halobacteriovoraceae bacterium]